MDRMIKNLTDIKLTNIEGIRDINDLIKERELLEEQLFEKTLKRKNNKLLQERHLVSLRRERLLNKENFNFEDFIKLCKYEIEIKELTRKIEKYDINKLEEEFELEGRIRNINNMIKSTLRDVDDSKTIYDTPEANLPQRGTFKFDEEYYNWNRKVIKEKTDKKDNRKPYVREMPSTEEPKVLSKQIHEHFDRLFREIIFKEEMERKKEKELREKRRTYSIMLKNNLNKFIKEKGINSIIIDEVETENMFNELSKTLFKYIGKSTFEKIILKENEYFGLEFHLMNHDNIFYIKGKDELRTNIVKASNNMDYDKFKNNFYKVLRAYKKLEEDLL